jgi:PPOX class probable F420-dependent enzyme
VLDPSKEAHAHADRRLRSEQVAWLTTVRADGQAQSTPVWFLWDGETFLVYSQPGAPKVRNVTANPRVSLHLNDDGEGDDVVTLYQTAIAAVGYEPGPFARTYSTPIRVRPTRVRVW